MHPTPTHTFQYPKVTPLAPPAPKAAASTAATTSPTQRPAA